MNDRHTQNGAAVGRDEERQAQLTAYALGQLEGAELEQVETWLKSPEGAEMRTQVEQTRRLANTLSAGAKDGGELSASPDLRSAVLRCLDAEKAGEANSAGAASVALAQKPAAKRARLLPIALVGGVLSLLVAVLAWPTLQSQLADRSTAASPSPSATVVDKSHSFTSSEGVPAAPSDSPPTTSVQLPEFAFSPQPRPNIENGTANSGGNPGAHPFSAPGDQGYSDYSALPLPSEEPPVALGLQVPSQTEGKALKQLTDSAAIADPTPAPGLARHGGEPYRIDPVRQEGRLLAVKRQLSKGVVAEAEVARLADGRDHNRFYDALDADHDGTTNLYSLSLAPGTEQYDPIVENAFLSPTDHPLSTFSIDVDTASYANVRRFLTSGRLPPPSAVRIEELVNYFSYDYPQPKEGEPFSVNLEMAECPWQEGHRLLRVGLKGKDVHRENRPQSNLVFLLDVSGSMDEPNKLPLVKQSLTMLVQELTENDRVSIVTYAGNAGLVLPPTSGDQKRKILDSIESLTPGGSTHGSAGIQLAYDLAAEYFREKGTNRVILATDGDLNVGVTSDEALVELIKEKAKGGTFLTVLGFGEGNLKDSKMEKLADNGNGIYAYIDGAREGRKVLVEQMTGSLITIAKDVKIQIEFNPAEVASYRLVGYENRILAAEDFNDDKKDAGEIGAGHSVTAIYEVVPAGAEVKKVGGESPTTDPLKYQAIDKEVQEANEGRLTEAAKQGELLTLKLRYKEPDGDTSKLLEYPLKEKGGSFNSASKEMQFASAVASFGMVLRQSEHRGTSNLAAVEEIATGALGKDDGGYRAEFVDLVKRAGAMGLK